MENKVGLYVTLIFHLSVLIVLLVCSIGGVVSKETSFVLDFSKQEEIEREKEVIEMKEKVSKELDQLLAAPSGRVRNVAVNAGERLKDDRHKDPSKVYDEARDLQRKLDATKAKSQAIDKADQDAYAALNKKDDKVNSDDKPYSGPSVISWRLDGRKAYNLPVPAYRGYGSGDVAVRIIVNKKGRVIKAEVVAGASANDSSLWDFALSAAKRSVFSSVNSPEQQEGEIVYRFIAQ
ncbi:MAG: hypothetical protein HUJ92_05910 [Bacteroidales bacterium]|nr:hypothetical protein [Bacteroidales bacterium]